MTDFTNWPEHLTHKELVDQLRRHAWDQHRVGQIIAQAFPADYPLGDGEIIPIGQRLVLDDAQTMAAKAVAEIGRLRRALMDEFAELNQEVECSEQARTA